MYNNNKVQVNKLFFRYEIELCKITAMCIYLVKGYKGRLV